MKVDTTRPIVRGSKSASIPVINSAGSLVWRIVSLPAARKFRLAYNLSVMEVE